MKGIDLPAISILPRRNPVPAPLYTYGYFYLPTHFSRLMSLRIGMFTYT